MSYYEIVQKVLPKDEPFIQIPPNASNIEVKVTESTYIITYIVLIPQSRLPPH